MDKHTENSVEILGKRLKDCLLEIRSRLRKRLFIDVRARVDAHCSDITVVLRIGPSTRHRK